MKDLLKKLKIKQENLIPIVGTLGTIVISFVLSSVFKIDFNTIAVSIVAVLWFLIFSFITFFAGLAVFRSLFFVGASLSLVIFIAQQYCGLPDLLRNSNDSIQVVFTFGLLYIVAVFINKLWDDIKLGWSKLKMSEDGKKAMTWITITLFGISTGFFLWHLCRIIYPIILGLCVYK